MRYLIWVVVLAGAWGFVQVRGLPHIRAQYVYSASSTDPFAERDYHECTYLGPYGTFKIMPRDGRCPLFMWRRELMTGAQGKERQFISNEQRPRHVVLDPLHTGALGDETALDKFEILVVSGKTVLNFESTPVVDSFDRYEGLIEFEPGGKRCTGQRWLVHGARPEVDAKPAQLGIVCELVAAPLALVVGLPPKDLGRRDVDCGKDPEFFDGGQRVESLRQRVVHNLGNQLVS